MGVFLMPLNLLNPAHPKTLREIMMNLLSGRAATKFLGIASNTFQEAAREGIIRSSIPKEFSQYGAIYRYDEKYLKAIKKLLPKDNKGGRGYKVFTDEIKAKILKINKDQFGE
jgi:hypothetical protein